MCLFVYLFICLFAYIRNRIYIYIYVCVCAWYQHVVILSWLLGYPRESNLASWRIPQLGDSSKEKRPGWVPTDYLDDVPPKKKQSNMANGQSPKKSWMVSHLNNSNMLNLHL